MTKRTYITLPDGDQILVEQESGCGCSTFAWILLVLFLVALPAAAFPTWLAVICYVFEALVVLAFVYRNRDAWQAR